MEHMGLWDREGKTMICLAEGKAGNTKRGRKGEGGREKYLVNKKQKKRGVGEGKRRKFREDWGE